MWSNLAEYGSLVLVFAAAGTLLALLLRLCIWRVAGNRWIGWSAASLVGLMPSFICLLGILFARDLALPITAVSHTRDAMTGLVLLLGFAELFVIPFTIRVVLYAEAGQLVLMMMLASILCLAALILTLLSLLAAGQLLAGASL